MVRFTHPTNMTATDTAPSTGRVILRRAVRTLVLAVFVFASLLTFPNALPWMVAAWVGGHAWLVLRSRRSWLPLAGCAAVLLAKNPPWLPGVGLLIVAVGVAGLLARGGRETGQEHRRDRRRGVRVGVLAAGWTIFALDWWAIGRTEQTPFDGRPIVLLGDSLTADMPPYGSYAEHLQTLVEPRVFNFGRPGITTTQAIEILPEALAARPQVVVVELGGHDYLNGRSREETRANLERIVAEGQAAGAAVVLVEVPRGLIRDPYRGLERELARRHGLALVPDTSLRRLVLQSRYSPLDAVWPAARLSEDGIHPNRQGNRLLAEHVAAAIGRVCETHP